MGYPYIYRGALSTSWLSFDETKEDKTKVSGFIASISIDNRDSAIALYFNFDKDDTHYETIDAGGTLEHYYNQPYSQKEFHLKSASGTPNVEIHAEISSIADP